MPDALTISRAEPDGHGPSYVELRDEGIRLVQQLAGEIWTDYNEHDPGVTILEQLCYALTELSYRAGFPMADLLAGEGGSVDAARQALFPSIDIFPASPLTISDYRRLIADRVPAVGNVWITPLPPTPGAKPVSGLYDVELHVPGADLAGDVREQVRRVYASNRNLCEDLYTVRVLAQVRCVVRAAITIDDSRPPETILAELLFNAGRALAPEISREPLDALLARGLSPSEIFEGPLLRDGFIGDDQLTPRAMEIGIPEIARILARTGGVLGVRDVIACADGAGEVSGNGVLLVPPSSVLTLETLPGDGGDFSIRLLRRGAPCKVDPTRVGRELERLRAAVRRRYPLAAQYDKSFAVPRGRARDLAEYTSIQLQFPTVYGINAYGPPDEATPLRRAQAKQLKGYLLVFEQLLADFFAQLGRARDLFSTDRTLEQTYFHQSIAEAVPDAGDLLDPDYQSKLDAALRSLDPATDRRNRFLDVLLALHADRLEAPAIAGLPADVHAGEHLIPAKIALLEHLVASTRDRGRGFDYLAVPSARDVAGMEIRSRLELGLAARDHRSLLESLEEAGLDLVEEHASSSLGRLHGAHADVVEATFEPVTAVLEDASPPDAAPHPASPPAPLLRGHTITESLLHAAASLTNFRVGVMPGESEVSLVCKAPGDEHYHLIGKYPEVAAAVVVALALVELCRTLSGRSKQLYLVEHTLLRFGRFLRGEARREHRHDDRKAFVYAFTVSAVLSHPPGAGGAAFEQTAREILRRNTPAHIAVEVCFLRPSQMRRFEELHRAWRDALHQRRHRAIIHASVRLRSFLERRRTPAW